MIGLALLIGLAVVWGGSLIAVLIAFSNAPHWDEQQIDQTDTTERPQDAPGTDASFDYWGDW